MKNSFLFKENSKEIFFVSTNSGKVELAKMVLNEYGFSVTQFKDSIKESEETNDPKVIVTEKIKNAIKKLNRPVICEDGGFFVNAFGGNPGASVHTYLTKKGISGLIDELGPTKDRSAHFLGVLAYMEPEWDEPVYFEEKIEGEITEKPRGTLKPYSWSELHLVFIPKGKKKTLAEMSEKEFLEFSHRQTSRFKRLGEYLLRRGE